MEMVKALLTRFYGVHWRGLLPFVLYMQIRKTNFHFLTRTHADKRLAILFGFFVFELENNFQNGKGRAKHGQ